MIKSSDLELIFWRIEFLSREKGEINVDYLLKAKLAATKKAEQNIRDAKQSLSKAQERIGLDLATMLDRVSK